MCNFLDQTDPTTGPLHAEACIRSSTVAEVAPWICRSLQSTEKCSTGSSREMRQDTNKIVSACSLL